MNLGTIFLCLAGLCFAAAVFAVPFCLIREKGPVRDRLLRVSILLAAALLLRFGGQGLLSLMGMGWRCLPRNLLNGICVVLLVVTLWRCMNALAFSSHVTRLHAAMCLCGIVSLFCIVIGSVLYYTIFSWSDWTMIQDGQSVVVASDGHGSHGNRRYFLHINGLVHGQELEYDWHHMKPTLNVKA